jgi:hypothetical protein
MAVCKPTGWHWRRPDNDALAEAVARNIYGVAGRIPAAHALRVICGKRYVISRGKILPASQPAVYSFPSR